MEKLPLLTDFNVYIFSIRAHVTLRSLTNFGGKKIGGR